MTWRTGRASRPTLISGALASAATRSGGTCDTKLTSPRSKAPIEAPALVNRVSRIRAIFGRSGAASGAARRSRTVSLVECQRYGPSPGAGRGRAAEDDEDDESEDERADDVAND